jgi:hypothetical protein
VIHVDTIVHTACSNMHRCHSSVRSFHRPRIWKGIDASFQSVLTVTLHVLIQHMDTLRENEPHQLSWDSNLELRVGFKSFRVLRYVTIHLRSLLSLS